MLESLLWQELYAYGLYPEQVNYRQTVIEDRLRKLNQVHVPWWKMWTPKSWGPNYPNPALDFFTTPQKAHRPLWKLWEHWGTVPRSSAIPAVEGSMDRPRSDNPEPEIVMRSRGASGASIPFGSTPANATYPQTSQMSMSSRLSSGASTASGPTSASAIRPVRMSVDGPRSDPSSSRDSHTSSSGPEGCRSTRASYSSVYQSAQSPGNSLRYR